MTDTYVIPALEPTQLIAGDSLTFTRDLSAWGVTPATFTVAYHLMPITTGNALITVAAGDNGDGTFLVNVINSTTELYKPDTYLWQCRATSIATGTESHTLFTGNLVVLADFATAAQANFQSAVKQVLDALEALIAGKLTVDQQSVSVMGRSITKLTVAEVLDARNYYAELYEAEQRKQNNIAGRPSAGRSKLRFSDSANFTTKWWFPTL